MAITRLGVNNISNSTIANLTALPAAIATGKVLQVQTTNTSTKLASTSTSFIASGIGLSVNITPSSTSNKIFVIASTCISNSSNESYCTATLYRDSTNLGNSNLGMGTVWGSASSKPNVPHTMQYLDSPSSTSQITYEVYFRAVGSGTVYLNGLDNNNQGTITAFEIAV